MKVIDVDRIREMRLRGVMNKDIAKELGISIATVSKYASDLPRVKVDLGGRLKTVVAMVKSGLSVAEIVEKTGLRRWTVYNYIAQSGLKANWDRRFEGESVATCKGLYMDGYSKRQISEITGLTMLTVNQYVKGVKPPFQERKPNPKTVKNPDQKTKQAIIKSKIRTKHKERVSTIDQRSMLGKGVESGVYTTEVKMRGDRDSGRLITLMYSDLSENPTVRISIRVKDDISDEEAVERWAKKHGKKSWRLA